MHPIDKTSDEIRGIIDHFVQNPILLVFIALAVALVFGVTKFKGARAVNKDEQRMFSTSQKAEAKRRAGGRCEHAGLIFRCRADGEHADHIFPHSRGGMSTQSNCQSLCAPHNLQKSAKIPSLIYIKSLERRRKKYFPEGVDRKVEWRSGKATN